MLGRTDSSLTCPHDASAVTPRRSRWASLLIALVAGLVVALGLAAPIAAQANFADEVANGLIDGGFVIEDGADGSDVVTSAASAAADDGVGTAVLAAEADSTAREFAAAVLDRLPADSPLHTVLIVTPNSVGAASAEYLPNDVNSAVTAARAQSGTADVIGAFTASVAGRSFTASGASGGTGSGSDGGTVSRDDGAGTDADEPAPVPSETPATSSDGGGGSGLGVLALFFGIPLLFLIGLGWWSRRKVAKRQEENLEKARNEVKAQVSAIALLIYDLNDRVSLSDDDELRETFAITSTDYQELAAEIDTAETGPELAAHTDRADYLRWRLETVAAKLDGREPPPAPQKPVAPSKEFVIEHDREPVPGRRGRISRGTCFFDPQHRPGIVPATIEMNGGAFDALLCRECSRRLQDGQQPEHRTVDIGGRRVPIARAPVGYGGLGLALADLFRVKAPGMSQGVQFDWTSSGGPLPKGGSRPRAQALPTRPRRRSARRRSTGRGRRRLR